VTVVDQRPEPVDGADFILGDLTDQVVVDKALGTGPAAVIHLAAATSVLRSVEAPDDVFRSNVGVTQALLEGCRLRGVGRFLFASTNAVVGPWEPTAAITEATPLAPLTPYGATKAAAEMLLVAYRSAYDMATTSLRLTNVYGPGVWVKDGFVSRLMRAARSRSEVVVYGDGGQVRDYVYLDDVVAAFAAALTGEWPARVIVGAGRSVTALDLLGAVGGVAGSDIAYRLSDPPAGEMRAVVVQRDLADRLGLGPATPLEEGLGLTWSAWPDPDPGPRAPLRPRP